MSLLRLIVVAGGFALGAYYAARCAGKAAKHPGKTVKDQVANWENEGGNVPNVATPRPTTGSSYVRGTQ